MYYMYWEKDGKKSGEGLVASGRWYPGLFVDEQIFFGLHD